VPMRQHCFAVRSRAYGDSEGDVLHPIVGVDGVHRFDPGELARVAGDRSARALDSSKEGERDAQVFEALEEGKGLREIVTTLRLPVDLVSKLHAAWLKMGSNRDMLLSSDRLATLCSMLGADVKTPTNLVEEVQWLAERSNELEAERSKLDNHLSDLVGAIGKAAASDPHVVKALPELSSHLPPTWPSGSIPPSATTSPMSPAICRARSSRIFELRRPRTRRAHNRAARDHRPTWLCCSLLAGRCDPPQLEHSRCGGSGSTSSGGAVTSRGGAPRDQVTVAVMPPAVVTASAARLRRPARVRTAELGAAAFFQLYVFETRRHRCSLAAIRRTLTGDVASIGGKDQIDLASA